MSDYAGLGAIFAIFGGFIFILGIVGIVNYVLMSLGLMNMAKNQNIDNPWLAWIPIGNLWIIGKIIKTVDLGEKKFEQAELILVIAAAASILLGAIPVIGTLISLAVTILYLLVVYKLYKMYAAQSAMLYLILTIVFAIIAPGIIFFKIKDNTPVEV